MKDALTSRGKYSYHGLARGVFHYLLAIAYFVLSLAGCSTMNTPVSLEIISSFRSTVPNIEGLSGVYHRVLKGQTLWSISRLYGVDLDDIVRINNIDDAAQMRAGQSIFVPHAQRPLSKGYAARMPLEDFIWPARGNVLSGFGEKNGNIVNKGINIRIGSPSDVIASRSGSVVFTSETLSSYGKTIIVEHEDGFMTVYTYTSVSQILVRPGEYVAQGTPIAKVDSGILHFEIRKGHIPKNPYYYLNS